MVWKSHSGIASGRSLGLKMQAEAFLPVVLDLLDTQFAQDNKLDDIDVGVRPLYNGREAGYCVVLKHQWAINAAVNDPEALHIFFSECRSSDGFFVQTWTAKPPYNGPTVDDIPDNSYEERHVVGWLRFDEASKHVRECVGIWLSFVEAAIEAEKAHRESEKEELSSYG